MTRGAPALAIVTGASGKGCGRAMTRRGDGIRVNCLAPGWIATDGRRQYWESLTPAERLERGVPSKLLSTSQIGDAVVRLATDTSLAGRVLV
jgi:NAD(P)-dependent dehydrogenase (short-subunit alcohol dehydrogenase family)